MTIELEPLEHFFHFWQFLSIDQWVLEIFSHILVYLAHLEKGQRSFMRDQISISLHEAIEFKAKNLSSE